MHARSGSPPEGYARIDARINEVLGSLSSDEQKTVVNALRSYHDREPTRTDAHVLSGQLLGRMGQPTIAQWRANHATS